jgi:hypothetical protein
MFTSWYMFLHTLSFGHLQRGWIKRISGSTTSRKHMHTRLIAGSSVVDLQGCQHLPGKSSAGDGVCHEERGAQCRRSAGASPVRLQGHRFGKRVGWSQNIGRARRATQVRQTSVGAQFDFSSVSRPTSQVDLGHAPQLSNGILETSVPFGRSGGASGRLFSVHGRLLSAHGVRSCQSPESPLMVESGPARFRAPLGGSGHSFSHARRQLSAYRHSELAR